MRIPFRCGFWLKYQESKDESKDIINKGSPCPIQSLGWYLNNPWTQYLTKKFENNEPAVNGFHAPADPVLVIPIRSTSQTRMALMGMLPKNFLQIWYPVITTSPLLWIIVWFTLFYGKMSNFCWQCGILWLHFQGPNEWAINIKHDKKHSGVQWGFKCSPTGDESDL